MSYFKLDRTQIIYNSKKSNPYVFLSEVIDSDCSSVTPKLISSSEDLDIYFGTSFTQRDYYNELLHYGASLLLYRPIKGETYGEPIVDISEYQEIWDPDTQGTKDYIFFDNLPPGGLLPGETTPGKWKFYLSTEGINYIWYEGEYIREDEIPIEENLSSFLNRDTLRLITKEFSRNGKFSWCHPKYRNRSYTPNYTEDLGDGFAESLLQSIYSHGVDDETRSIGYIMDFTEVKEFRESDYIVFPLPSSPKFQYTRVQLYFGDTPPLGSDIISGAWSRKVTGDTTEEKITWIVNALQEEFDYKISQVGPKKYIIYTSDMIQDLHFYTVPGFILETDFETTQNIYSIISEPYKRLEMFSKTIGPGDEDIKVKIEKLQGNFKEHYRISISRYSYSEVFEGPLYIEENPDTLQYTSLEKIINQGSKLVEVKVYNTGRSKDNPEDGLIPGDYILRRAKSEKDYFPEDYWRALDKIKETDISEDFLLVPEIDKYEIRGASSDLSWIYEYERLLDYSVTKNCQVLISNHPWKYDCTELQILSERPENPEENIMYGIEVDKDTILYQKYSKKNGWRIYNSDPEHKYLVHEIEEAFGDSYPGNHIHNYTKDKWNRLVYFYEDMTYLGHPRPAYYIFLDGIMTGKYSEETNKIIYPSPVDPYSEGKSNLREYKSNFLSCNEHIFYYKEFFNHPGSWDYEVTILTRFCMNKVTNTISRELPYYLGSETSGEVIRGLQGILDRLTYQYPIIYSLGLDYIEEDTQNQTLSVYLNLEVREMLEHDIKLSVTLNFNNN